MNNIYEKYLETSAVGTQESAWKIEEIKVNYSRFFPADKNACCLDIGIGNGEMLHLLKDCGYTNAEGADISPSTIKACMARGYNCTLIEDTAEFLKQNKNKYAMISMFHVIEHISKDDIIPIINACYEALTDDGVLILETPNMASYDAVYSRYADFTHVMGYAEPSLRQMLMIGGFKNITIFGTDIIFQKKLSNIILKLLNKINKIIFYYLRRTSGLHTESPTELYLSAIAYKKQKYHAYTR